MKILFFMDCWPYPIDNGVTVVIANMANELYDGNDIYIYNYQESELCILDNLSNLIKCDQDITSLFFDIVICSPILALKEFNKQREKIKYEFLVGWLNDCYSYVLLRHALVSYRVGHFDVKDIVSLLKVPLVYAFENMIISKANIIVGQSQVEKTIFRNYFPFSPDCKVLPNSTQFEVEENDVKNLSRDGVGLVASFNSTYIKVAKWFISNVWVRVHQEDPTIKLHLLGKNSDKLLEFVKLEHSCILDSIVLEHYYEKIEEFYKKRKVVVSPIFKNLGLINKTIEAMHCGCIVVGDMGAFNGVPGFKNHIHGVVVDDMNKFHREVISLYNEDNNDISINAHRLIEDKLSWKLNAAELINAYHFHKDKND